MRKKSTTKVDFEYKSKEVLETDDEYSRLEKQEQKVQLDSKQLGQNLEALRAEYEEQMMLRDEVVKLSDTNNQDYYKSMEEINQMTRDAMNTIQEYRLNMGSICSEIEREWQDSLQQFETFFQERTSIQKQQEVSVEDIIGDQMQSIPLP